LNDYEKPIAALTCMTANINRSSKTKPFSPSDFFFYKTGKDVDGPGKRYGAAYMHLAKKGQLPSWALFCYKAVSANAGASVPEFTALTSNEAILLAPVATSSGFKGMLIAREAAKGVQTFRGPDGMLVDLVVDDIPTKVVAIEDVELRRLR
jgi:hypothetical protein